MDQDKDQRAPQSGVSRRGFIKGGVLGLGLVATDLAALATSADAATNTITQENALPGTTDDWEIFVFDSDAVEGFPDRYSINAGERVGFKINTDASNYEVKIYRIGWYGGVGARKVATLQPSVTLPQTQPAYFEDSETGLIDCGNWSESAFWDVPANAVSGVYVANIELLDGSGARNRMLFVVRNDGRNSDILVQTSDATYQAYNFWGGSSLYFGYAISGRGTKVSYNRPYNPGEIENDFFYGEVPLVRWLERNGYDVSYCGCVDTATRPAELLDHQIFVSSGHDEYWSQSMRDNVEAARDAGVHLVFMTGNEVFWRVRWENSPVTSGSHETMVCYKETLANAKIDPSPEWTGTWRDPRFTPPASGGGNPENALTGTLFRAINPVNDVDFAIKVPSTYKNLRIWRNTSIANLTAGSTATLSDMTLGYEWNTDADNGSRPAGLIRMSETTEIAKQVLQDNGSTYIEAPLTHYLTMYRASSGALVWSTGTNQWSWGLDDQHFNRPSVAVPTDVRIQQATLNVLADMGVQPATRQPELVAASASTDSSAPTSTIQLPPDGASAAVGTQVAVSGSASDSGGVVAGVEVSVDGGTTWHPAEGTTSWSYTFIPTTVGATTILSRATDDSCNTETPGVGRNFVATNRPTPAFIWPASTVPAISSASDSSALELGVRFSTAIDGFITGIRFYKGNDNTGEHVGRLWSNQGLQLGSVTFTGETAAGWQLARFANAVPVSAGVTYVASYTAPNGGYAVDPGGLTGAYELAPLRALAAGEDGPNGVFGNAGGFPNSSFGSSNYWVDIEFDTDNSAPPAVVEKSPASNVSSVAVDAPVVAIFSEAIQSSTAQMTLTGPVGPVAGTTSYNSSEKSITFTPSAVLDPNVQYTASVSEAVDLNDETMAPVSWSFTTAGIVGELPGSIWTSSAEPDNALVSDANPIEVGVKFTSSVDGIVTAIRFYQGAGTTSANVGRLWDQAGNVLGTATFVPEPGIGWREAQLDSPVDVTKDTIYLASYLAQNGRYAFTFRQFDGASVTRGALTAPSSGQVGGNGVYRYGAAGGFPTSSYNGSNYWVDIVMEAAPDFVAPFVANVVPGPDLQAVSPAEPVVVTFDGPVDPNSVTFTLTNGGSPVPASLSFPASATVALTPNTPLANGATYQASVLAADTSGNVMAAPYQWGFTTAAAPGGTPASIRTTAAVPATEASDDGSAIEVGVKFFSDISGSISAIRFYRGPGNDGPHVGNLWDAQGNLLGSVSFANETAVGWQQANFPTPIPIAGGQTYTASYHAPNGRYAITNGGLGSAAVRAPLTAPASGTSFGNGVFAYGGSGYPSQSFASSDYGVDVIFLDDGGPGIAETIPAAGASSVDVDGAISVTFTEPIASGTMVAELRDGGGGLVPVIAAQDNPTTFTITPTASLIPGSSYTATVVDAQDSSGIGMVSPHSWSFTTADNSFLTLFGSATPAVVAANDPSAIELGMRFEVNQSVEAAGIRFYRSASNVGPHVGHLWTAAGTQLAEVTFAGGGPDGWQYAALAAPIPLVPGEEYVVSYFTQSGGYSVDGGFFNNGDVVSGPLVGVGNSGGTPNGLYNYGGGFPTGSYNASNYWVDVHVELPGGGA